MEGPKVNDTNGSQWPIEELDEKSRLADLKGALGRGNHKSAKENGKFLSESLVKEINKVWEFILPLHRAMDIPGPFVSPMGVEEQLGVSATGDFVPKKRLTSDLSFPGSYSGK